VSLFGRSPSKAAQQGVAAPLLGFITEARRSGRRRLAVTALADASIASVLCLLLGAWIAAATLRGDLVAPLVAAGVLLAMTFSVVRLVVWGYRRWGTPLRAARTIADWPRPLGVRIGQEQLRQHKLLRHEILGAFELSAETENDHSRTLAMVYVEDVGRRATARSIDPSLALPSPNGRARAWAAAALAVALAVAAGTSMPFSGLILLVQRADARPPAPRQAVWSALDLTLHYPAYTERPARSLANPTGALRVLAGTVIVVQLRAREPSEGGRLVLNYDGAELTDAPPAEIVDLGGHADGWEWSGSFVARFPGTWTIVMHERGGPQAGDRSTPMRLELEVDRPPEIELLPLPQDQQEVDGRDQVDIRFHARDDFGLSSASLVYQLPDGSSHRLPIAPPIGRTRTWQHRHAWDIGEIPTSRRSEVLYWVEVRDNDPGLGPDPLPDPPGKVARSSTMRLTVRDEESEHTENIARLSEIRDAGVDLLARRMTTEAFDRTDPTQLRVAAARALLGESSRLIAMLVTVVDLVAMDTLSGEGDAVSLAGIHRRLAELHREELALHEGLSAQEHVDVDARTDPLNQIGSHNAVEVRSLEDELIRIDDLVDNQMVERVEALVARLEATQRKLVEELELLKAGDESARQRIEQLELRRREDMRRLAEARAALNKEVEHEFMNFDAFTILERIQRDEELGTLLSEGRIDEALGHMRGQLGDLQRLRDQIQSRLGGANQTGDTMSEEDRVRMQLLRELSRLQDDERTLNSQTRPLHERWRDAAKQVEASRAVRQQAGRRASALRKRLADINDARLGRNARRHLEDAIESLRHLEHLGEGAEVDQLALAENAHRALAALRVSEEGADPQAEEGRQLREAATELQNLDQSLRAPLPAPGEVFDAGEFQRLEELERRQRGLRERGRELLDGKLSPALPPVGRQALRRADAQMNDSADELDDESPAEALDRQHTAIEELQRAIDALRQASPPPSQALGTEASTEAERDRSLRDALVDAMREDAPDGFAESVWRYYGELLR